MTKELDETDKVVEECKEVKKKVTRALKVGMQLIKRMTKSDLGKKLGGEALRHAPILSKKHVSKIKNGKLKEF